MRTDKSAFFIKRYGQRAVTCSNLQNRIFICIFTYKEVNHIGRELGGKLRGAVVAVFQCVVAWCVAAGLYQLLLLIV